MIRRSAIRASIGVLTGLALLATFAGTVAAHTPTVYLTCNVDHHPELVISLTNYNGTQSNGHYQNTVSASIDGITVLPTTVFGGSYSNTFSAGSPYVGHSAEVVIFAFDDPQGVNHWTRTFDLQSPACLQPTPSPTPTDTPTATPTATPTDAPTATPTPTPTETPFQSFQGETATPAATPTDTPFQSFEGETATPASTTTPPPTSTGSSDSGNGPTPLFALLICVAFGGLGLAAIQGQRRTSRR